eukprot:11862009-Karenia_brevis.AAC.1
MEVGPPLAKPTPAQIRRAALSIKQETALSGDYLHPRSVTLLDDAALDDLAEIFLLMEEVGLPPLQMLMLVFIPKPDGGRRPIGLLTGLMRLWGKVRREYARAWEEENARPYFWAGRGRPAADSAHQQALKAEIARAKDLASASTLLDMVKCYERIQHHVVAAAAKRTGFNLRIIRLCLAVYAGPRLLSVDGAVTELFRIGTSIVAGCSFATTILRVVLIELMDIGTRLYPNVSLHVYVDDIDIGMCGTEAAVVQQTFGATRMLILGLEQKVLATVSRRKSVVLGSSRSVRCQLADRLRELGIKA